MPSNRNELNKLTKKNTHQLQEMSQDVTNARQLNNVLAEQIRGMQLEMDIVKVRKKYVRFKVRKDFVRKFVKPTPWVLRWARWGQYALTKYYRRRKLMRFLTSN